MKVQQLYVTLVFLLGTSACELVGKCKTDADCQALHAEAYCYTGGYTKPGSDGICSYRASAPVESDKTPVKEAEKGPGDSSAKPEPAPGPPTIHRFGPAQAGYGTTLRIHGENFSTVSSENHVTLAGLPVPTANILSSTKTEITLKVPKNTLCTGPLQMCTGPVQLLVNDQTATSSATFSYELTATVTTFAGDGTAGLRDGLQEMAWFDRPWGLALDVENNLYVADRYNHRIRKVTPEGDVSTFAGVGLTGRDNGRLENGRATGSARFNHPTSMLIDTAGNFYVADSWNDHIRKITTSGTVSNFAGADGYCSTSSPACFDGPSSIVADASGNFYVVDAYNHRIVKVGPSGGTLSTFAGASEGREGSGFVNATGANARFRQPEGIAIDAAGNLYVTDTENHCIRKITQDRVVSTFAGKCTERGFEDGMGTDARFNMPNGIAMDAKTGTLYVADSDNHRIRTLSPEGYVSTLAGSGPTGCEYGAFADGAGTSVARFDHPVGIAVDKEGTLYVADSRNHRVRKIIME